MAKWGKCDFKQLQEFQKKIEKLANSDIDNFCRETAKELTARLLAKVIKRTPVGVKPKELKDSTIEKYWSGYVGGTLRRGWTARTEAEARSGQGSGKNPKEYADSLKIIKFGNNYSIIVENPVSYSDYVEHGHRQEAGRFVPQLGKKLKNGWVEGKFMLTISEKELQTQADSIVQKKLEKFLGECFKNG